MTRILYTFRLHWNHPLCNMMALTWTMILPGLDPVCRQSPWIWTGIEWKWAYFSRHSFHTCIWSLKASKIWIPSVAWCVCGAWYGYIMDNGYINDDDQSVRLENEPCSGGDCIVSHTRSCAANITICTILCIWQIFYSMKQSLGTYKIYWM